MIFDETVISLPGERQEKKRDQEGACVCGEGGGGESERACQWKRYRSISSCVSSTVLMTSSFLKPEMWEKRTKYTH